MSCPKPPKLIRPRNTLPQPDVRPRRTVTPWHGFGPGDWPREVPLARCPAPRCRRARQCIAAVNDLYCQRTHYSRAEQAALFPETELGRALAGVPRVIDPASLSERMERIASLAAVRRAHDAAMTAQWKAGLAAPRFGPYRAGGIVVSPPPKSYREDPPKKGGQGGRGAVQSPPLAPKRGRTTSGLGD